MANRPVFVSHRSASSFVQEIPVTFTWYPGLSLSQKQKSIDAFHAAARARIGVQNILEISSKSPIELGVRLSAFNLTLPVTGRKLPVEVVFQASKRFEHGGPYLDLMSGTSKQAKNDSRLRSSGALRLFEFDGESWPLEPKTAFYDWLYLHALQSNPDLADQIMQYQAFTDIEYNPDRSINCQARSAALFAGLRQEGLLHQALSSRRAFMECTSSFAMPSTRTLSFPS